MSAITVKNAPSSNKKVLILNGSPHKNGPTAQLIESFLEGIDGKASVTLIDCFSLSPSPCDGCGYCEHENGCSKRDLDEYYQALEEADVLVYALPVYNLSFPAPLKAILDRGQRYWSARFLRMERPPIKKTKAVVLLTVSGDSRTEENDRPIGGAMIEKQLQLPLTVLNGKIHYTIHYYGADIGNPIAPYLQNAREVGEKIL